MSSPAANVSATPETIPSYQQRAFKKLQGYGMNDSSIAEAVYALKSEGDGFILNLNAVKNVAPEVLCSWIQVPGMAQSNAHAPTVIQPSNNGVDPLVFGLSQSAGAVQPSTQDYLHLHSAVDNHKRARPHSFIEPRLKTVAVTAQPGRTSQFVARRCVGWNGKCAGKSGKEYKYLGPWKSHFETKHLSSYFDIDTGDYVCFCAMRDRGDGSELMQHIWDDHMLNATDESSTVTAQYLSAVS